MGTKDGSRRVWSAHTSRFSPKISCGRGICHTAKEQAVFMPTIVVCDQGELVRLSQNESRRLREGEAAFEFRCMQRGTGATLWQRHLGPTLTAMKVLERCRVDLGSVADLIKGISMKNACMLAVAGHINGIAHVHLALNDANKVEISAYIEDIGVFTTTVDPLTSEIGKYFPIDLDAPKIETPSPAPKMAN